MKLKIKKAELKDAKEMIKLEAKCFRMKYNKNFVWFWKPLIHHAYVYKVLFGTKVIGGIVAFPTRNFQVLHIESIFVDPKFRHHGIATKLIKKAETISKCEKIVLDTMPKWKEAVKLYKKNGFKTIKLMKNYYEDGTDRILMIKNVK